LRFTEGRTNLVSYALVFAGQGNQHPQMMPWLTVEQNPSVALLEMERVVGADWRTTLENQALCSKGGFAQPLVVGTALAAWALLKPLLPRPPTLVAGYSVGELAAFATAGVISVETAMGLATNRADWMDRSVRDGGRSGLISISGLAVRSVLAQLPRLNCAIVFDYDHAIFGAFSSDLDQAQTELAGTSAICKRLAIDVASHTPLMASASEGFSEVLARVTFQPPEFPIVLNFCATVGRRIGELKTALGAQLCTTINWAECMDVIAERGVHCVLEIGPNRALASLWNRRHPMIPARSIEEFKNLEGAAMWVQSHD
jgi:[acyl-carrier-protein] S-malonyltransferase